jgi:plasmid stabilization system protein ParE
VTELVWSPQALADVEEIRAYIAFDSRAYADLTAQRIMAAVERLKMFPDSGRMVPERQSPEIREVIAGRFRIVYRRNAHVVEIVTVFRGSREFPDQAMQ